MDYGFVAGTFVGKHADDNTDEGLVRRMILGGLQAALNTEEGVIWVTVPFEDMWADMADWIASIQKHYGCVFDGTREL